MISYFVPLCLPRFRLAKGMGIYTLPRPILRILNRLFYIPSPVYGVRTRWGNASFSGLATRERLSKVLPPPYPSPATQGRESRYVDLYAQRATGASCEIGLMCNFVFKQRRSQ